MPKENPPELIRPIWFGAIATTAIASIINFVILPMWFTLILSFGKSDIDLGNGIFAACDANTTSCSGPDIGFISLVVVTDRKSTRLNSSHVAISYAVFCLKKKK